MNKLVDLIDRLNLWVGKLIAWLVVVLVLLIVVDVVLRYLFNFGSVANAEMEWHLFGAIILLGLGYAYQQDRHVRVDLFYDQQAQKEKNQVNFWGTLLFLLPWCLVLIYTGWNSALDAYTVGERSPEASGLPNLWLIQFAIPVGIFFLLLQGLALLVASRPGQDLEDTDSLLEKHEE